MKIAIFDLDGVVCDANWRSRLAKAKQWDLFHSLCKYDYPIDFVITEMQYMQKFRGYKLVLMTGRTEAHREATEEWLVNNHVPYNELWMRGNKDFSKASLLKLGLVQSNYNRAHIKLFVDDNPPTVKALRDHGVPTLLFDQDDIKSINALRDLIDDLA